MRCASEVQVRAVAPFGDERPIEAFDFSIGLWAIGPSEAVGRRAEGAGEVPRAITATVVTEDALDDDPVVGEEP